MDATTTRGTYDQTNKALTMMKFAIIGPLDAASQTFLLQLRGSSTTGPGTTCDHYRLPGQTYRWFYATHRII